MRWALIFWLWAALGSVGLWALPLNSTTERRLPEAIIIGVKKCGTRALLEFLKLNSRIRAPAPEVHFFDRNYARGVEWYRDQMPTTKSHQITIEKSPGYFVSADAPRRVFALNPQMRLLVVVRNPITRAVSDYTQALVRHKRSLQPTFEQMAQCHGNETNKCENGINVGWSAIRIGIYWEYLERWLEYFPVEQFLFIDGENLIRSPATEIRKAEKFLGLEPVVTKENFVMDKVKGFPCVQKPNGPHCLSKSKGRTHPTVDLNVVQRLQDFYFPHNQRFFRLINRYFHWF